MGAGGEGAAVGDAAAAAGLFLVTSYTDIDKLAHLPKGDCAQQSVTVVQLDERTGKLKTSGGVSVGPNPAFAVKHPSLPLVYVSTENIKEDGKVYCLHMGPGGDLKIVGSTTSAGKSTCFLTFNSAQPDYLLAVSYWDARVSALPLDPLTGLTGDPTSVLETAGAEYVKANSPGREEHWAFRQRWPHSHCIVQEPYDRKYYAVTDLGLDRIFLHTLDTLGGRLERKAAVTLDKGRGPRHLLFHPRARVAYVCNELDSTVTVLAYNSEWEARLADTEAPAAVGEVPCESMHAPGAAMRHLQTLSSLPEEEQGKSIITPEGIWKAASHSSEIRLRPDGRYLYVGNRGHDSIAVYAIDEAAGGTLTLVEYAPSGGQCPRNFCFSGCGRYCVVGNQNSNLLVSFACCAETGRLSQVDAVPLPSPNYVYAVPQ